jgi:uncharacterized protein (DUF58 family)
MALDNTILVSVALVPFFFIVFSLAYPQPVITRVTRTGEVIMAHTNEAVGIATSLQTDAGSGIVTVADSLPEHFELVSGNNFHVFWNDGKSQIMPWSYEIRCTRRGTYDIGPSKVESFQPSWLGHTAFVSGEKPAKLIVKPLQISLRKMRDPRLRSSLPMPSGAASKLGMRTTDFMEIRHYSSGDAFRAINWKATARLSTAANPRPYVNEFEKEGKKTVLIFVDAGPWMGIGSTVDNVFEYAVQAASGIASFYLQRNLRVGVYVYNYGKFLLPDTGRHQASRLMGILADIQVSGDTAGGHSPDESDNSLIKAVKECSGHMAGINPQFIVITMVCKENATDLAEGVRSMHRHSYTAGRRGVMILHIPGYGLAASDDCEKAGATLLEAIDMPHVLAVKRAGADVVTWNPRMKSLSQVMIAGFGRRAK